MNSINKAAYQEVLSYLLCKTNKLETILDQQMFEDIFIHPREEVLSLFRKCLKSHLNDPEGLKRQREFASGMISLIPYTYPNIGERFELPIFNKNEKLKIVSYEVSKVFESTIDQHLSPLKAYALRSEEDSNVLIFTGTTFPSASGFLNSLIADFTPFTSVGKLHFKIFEKQLEEYFKDKCDVRVFGMSLGGALSLHALRQHHPKIKSVFAQVPAGLHFYDRFDPKMKTQVFIVTHSGDIVSKLGFFPEHSACHMVQVKAEQIKGVIAHAQLLANHENSTCIKLDPQIENRSLLRRILSAVHLVFSWLIFIPLAICFLAYKVYRLVDIFLKRLSSCFQKSQLPTHVPMSLSM